MPCFFFSFFVCVCVKQPKDYLKITVTAVGGPSRGSEDQSPTFMILPGHPREQFLFGNDTTGSTFTKADEGCSCWLKVGESDGPISVQGEEYTLQRFDKVSSVMVSSKGHSGWWMSSQKLQRSTPAASQPFTTTPQQPPIQFLSQQASAGHVVSKVAATPAAPAGGVFGAAAVPSAPPGALSISSVDGQTTPVPSPAPAPAAPPPPPVPPPALAHQDGQSLNELMRDAEIAAERENLNVVLLLPSSPKLTDFDVERRLGKKNTPVGPNRYYGVNSAVFAIVLRAATGVKLSMKVVFNTDESATMDVFDDYASDYKVTSRDTRLPAHANILWYERDCIIFEIL